MRGRCGGRGLAEAARECPLPPLSRGHGPHQAPQDRAPCWGSHQGNPARPWGQVQVGSVSHLWSQLTAPAVWTHRPPRVMAAEGTLGVLTLRVMHRQQLLPLGKDRERFWALQQSHDPAGLGPPRGSGTFFCPALLCHPRLGPHVTNPAPAAPIVVLGPARSLIRKRAFPSLSNLSIHHPWLRAWAGMSLVPPVPRPGCPTLPAWHLLAPTTTLVQKHHRNRKTE